MATEWDGQTADAQHPAVPEPGWWAAHWKAVMALLGTLTPGAVISWLNAAGVTDLPSWAQAAITVVFTVSAVLWGPRNK
jgi:hypothetical protein